MIRILPPGQRRTLKIMMKQICAFSAAAVLCLTFLPTIHGQGNAEAINLAHQGSEAAKAADWNKAVEAFRKATAMDRKWAPNLVAALQQRGAANMSQQK